MAKKSRTQDDFGLPTTMATLLQDGRLQGEDGSVWLYRNVPLAPVVDARTAQEKLNAAEPILAMFEELAAMTPVGVKRRSVAKSSYRRVHMLMVNVPRRFQPDRSHVLSDYLRGALPGATIDQRQLLFGVQLRPSVTGEGSIKRAVDSVVETVLYGGTPLSDYDADTERVAAMMDRSGLAPATSDNIRLANAWWNRGNYADTPMLYHADHIHVMPTVESVRLAEKAGLDSCEAWTKDLVPGSHAITFAAVHDLDLDFIDPADQRAAWVSDLIQSEALAVSVRGLVEPGAITREELRRQRGRYINDINERAEQGKMDRAEQQEMLSRLEGVEGLYATGAPPTLTAASTIAAFNGQYRDPSQILDHRSPVSLSLMSFRQHKAIAETWLCSHVSANPTLHDLPIQDLACSGLPSLSFVGDKDGALVGFTEQDRQPAWLSPQAASATDAAPLALVAGGTGSGKSLLMQWLANQFTRAGRPVVIWDPKQESDFSPVVESLGGTIYSLDSLLTADGAFDPIRFSPNPETGAEIAAAMLMSINPWGLEKENMEVPLQRAISHGVARGARCIGQALAIARAELPDLPVGLVERVEGLAGSSPQFRAIVGVNPAGEGMRASAGITYIKVGSAHLDLPGPGQEPTSVNQRVAMALVRMVVFGSAMALSGRDGVLMLDEAWLVLQAGRAEVERLGRLARSQRVLPMMFTQRVTDAVNAGLNGYISRGLILPLPDPTEAKAACELFKLEPTAERISRITEKATVGGTSVNEGAPNWNSMRHLRDPRTGKTLRGSVAIYIDLSGRAVPVEIVMPGSFVDLASTNPEDIRRREEARAAARITAASTTAPTMAPTAVPGGFPDRSQAGYEPVAVAQPTGW